MFATSQYAARFFEQERKPTTGGYNDIGAWREQVAAQCMQQGVVERVGAEEAVDVVQ